MDFDDIVYLSLLFISIGFGHVYRKIPDIEQKKIIGTATGLLIAIIVSGVHILHPIICTIINASIIFFINKRICHLVSFAYSFSHLIFFRSTEYFGIPYPPAHTNLVQMILTMKLVGLAFEVNSAYFKKKEAQTVDEKNNINEKILNISFIELFHYAFTYVGGLTGPYYSYKTYYDHFHKPYSKYGDCQRATFDKLKWVPMFIFLFLTITYIWPFSYANTDEFYEQRSWLYRLWYAIPTFAWFRMRIYIGLTLSECVCTMAGLGIYPKTADSKPGVGPSKEYDEITEETASTVEYDFQTIYNINPYGADFCVTFREGMKHWNMCIQYWLAVNIYKRFPIRALRVTATMFVSAFWHGVYAGYYFCICGVPFYLPVEDLYYKLLRKDAQGHIATILDWVFWVFKMSAFSYLGMAFHLLSIERVMKYYNSIYHAGAIMTAIFYVVGTYIAMSKKKSKANKSTNDKTD